MLPLVLCMKCGAHARRVPRILLDPCTAQVSAARGSFLRTVTDRATNPVTKNLRISLWNVPRHPGQWEPFSYICHAAIGRYAAK